MDIDTSAAIKAFFPNSSLLLVLFESIANSLDANATKISVEIGIDSFDQARSLNICIKDDGDGFTNENFSRFCKLLKPKDSYHKGVGRLVYLNYFERVLVDSCWGENGRKFEFNSDFDNSSTVYVNNIGKFETILSFKNFKNKKINSYDDLKPVPLANKLIEHFLPTFISLDNKNKKFELKISLKTKEENIKKGFYSDSKVVSNSDLPKMKHEEIDISGLDSLSGMAVDYLIEKNNINSGLITAVSVDGRTIPINLLKSKSIPSGYSALFVFSSEILSVSSDTTRQKLIFLNEYDEKEVVGCLRAFVGKKLSQYIPEIEKNNLAVKENLENTFPHMVGYFEDEIVGLVDGDQALNEAQVRFFSDQKEILRCENLSDYNYKKSMDVASRTLTEYVLYREKIIKKMQKITNSESEAEIHDLIVPKYSEFNESEIGEQLYRNNAWLLDEKFMTFQTVLSESRMDTIIKSIQSDAEVQDESGRPDIAMIFSGDPDCENTVDVVVVELKKKGLDGYKNFNAASQLLDRAHKLAKYCTNIQRIWYYAVVDIDEDFERLLHQMKWAPLFSRGKIFYQEFPTTTGDGKIIPTPITLMSYDSLISDAENRNHTFLHVLRDSIRKQAIKKS